MTFSRLRAAARTAAGALALAAGACGAAAPAPSTCPNDVSDVCPSPAPGYAADIAPLIQSRCLQCHAPGGMEASMPFTTYDQVQKNSMGILQQVHACLMPPQDQPQLTNEERATLFGWIVCGSVDD